MNGIEMNMMEENTHFPQLCIKKTQIKYHKNNTEKEYNFFSPS